jgi:23S rRNA-/tRNA-specific pseudouridylate synthase
VAYKPHFLPVTLGGKYIEECLQNLLRHTTGNTNLQAVHRIDKGAGGLVLFSVNRVSNGALSGRSSLDGFSLLRAINRLSVSFEHFH